jgi:hypothetical protein
MTGDKVKEVADRYERVVMRAVAIISESRSTIVIERGPVDRLWTCWLAKEQAGHLLFACAEMKHFVDENRLEKSFRWLGWVQGTFTALGVYTIDQCGNHNRPDPTAEDADADVRAAGRLACCLGSV